MNAQQATVMNSLQRVCGITNCHMQNFARIHHLFYVAVGSEDWDLVP